MKSHYWIKLYHEILDDAKMGRLEDRLWRRTIELFLMAGEEHNEGRLPSLADMAWRLRLDDDTLLEDLQALEQIDIVTQLGDDSWFVTHFAERQGPMSNAERQQRYRDSKRKGQYYGNTTDNTSDNDNVTKCNAEVDVDTDKEVDVEVACNDNPFSLYEQATASTLTPILADRIGDLIDECEDHRLRLPPQANGSQVTGADWVCHAIREAVESTNKFGLRYVAAILDRWRSEGYDSRHSKHGGNGKDPPKTRRIRPIMPDGTTPEVEVVA